MAAFKAHCSFGFWDQEMQAILAKDGHAGAEGMGSFGKLTSLAELPGDRTLSIDIRAAVKLNASNAPTRPRLSSKPKAKATVPADLAAGLKRNKLAAATFAAFSPSQRRARLRGVDCRSETGNNTAKASRHHTRLARRGQTAKLEVYELLAG